MKFTVDVDIRVPSGLSAAKFIIDSFNRIVERNEKNNRHEMPILCQGGLDLSADSFMTGSWTPSSSPSGALR